MAFTGCLANYLTAAGQSTDGSGGCMLMLPEEGWTLAPWVEISFVNFQGATNGVTVTVGNMSSSSTTPANEAVIKSFEFGYSDGITVKVTVHDQQGGSFEQFMANMLSDWACLKCGGSPATTLMRFRFGWVKSGCSTPVPSSVSNYFFCLCDSVETNFTEGKFIFDILGHDLCHRMFEGGSEVMFGGEGQNSISVTEAIIQLMTNSEPPCIDKVSFKQMQGGVAVDYTQAALFEGQGDDAKNGPSGKWIAQGKDKLQTAIDWLRTCPAQGGLGWRPQFNPMGDSSTGATTPTSELIFWVDPLPRTVQPDSYWDSNCIGSFIVNGGLYSPVLDFNPKIRWDFASLTSVGGNFGPERLNAMQTEGSKNPGSDITGLGRQDQPGAGQKTQTTIDDGQRDRSSTPTKDAALADAQHKKAMKLLYDNIEADLVIIGNPTIAPPSEAILSKNVSIILINPFYLTQPVPNNADALEWLSQPPCNSVMSSKAWVCKSITHHIEAGKYTTTIGVMLAAPGIDIPPGSPIGGWSGGWTPTAVC